MSQKKLCVRLNSMPPYVSRVSLYRLSEEGLKLMSSVILCSIPAALKATFKTSAEESPEKIAIESADFMNRLGRVATLSFTQKLIKIKIFVSGL